MSDAKKRPVICLMGPTGAGKTDLAITLLEHFSMQIISVDSAMIYRGMDIGTAKPEPEILAKAPHRLIDIRDPDEVYSAGQFVEDAKREIDAIHAKNHLPLLVGGTKLYFRALQSGLANLPSADPAIRRIIEEKIQTQGLARVHDELKTLDPIAANRIHPNDPQRIQRAMEVYCLTGKPLSHYWHEQQPQDLPYDFINLALVPTDRKKLHDRIAQRFKTMLKRGFIEEVKTLYQNDTLHNDLPALRAVGYRQAWSYLSGDLTFNEMQDRAIIATRQYAKRQLTWLRRWPNLKTFDCDAAKPTDQVCTHLTSAAARL